MWGTVALLFVSLVFSGVITDNVFKGRSGLVVCLLVALVTYAAQHLTLGTLSGNGRFGPYGVILGAEGAIRLVPSVALWLAGVHNPLAYGFAFAIAPALASAFALRGERGLVAPGPQAP
jgi:hypothetical protein